MKAVNKLELSTAEEPKDSIMNLLEKKFSGRSSGSWIMVILFMAIPNNEAFTNKIESFQYKV